MLLALAGCARDSASPPQTPKSTPAAVADVRQATFVGSERCVSCHASEGKAWRDSQHHHAMEPADAQSVRGRFDGRKIEQGGIVSRFFTRDGRLYINTDGPSGKLEDIEVKYTFGLEPLQQYLVEMPRGHLQALPLAWDARPNSGETGQPRETVGQRWFHLYPHERLRAGDTLHWTGYLQNWNLMCADCHTTNLRKNYDAASDSYATTWSELGVGCESCHGPGSRHLDWAQSPSRHPELAASRGLGVRFDERRGVTWLRDSATGLPARSTPRSTATELEVCARCHSRRGQLTDAVNAADSFHDGFRASLLEPGLYWPDGQMRDEVFNYGSFLQSKMHAAGVTCGDCHEPHSGKLRVSGDATCLQCHDARLATPEHHFHPQESAGARCVSCHMPATTYMSVDARHDHSFRIPRPDRTVTLGTPNACTACHADQTAEWAQKIILSHYPHPKPGFQSFGEAFLALERGEQGAASSVASIAADLSQPAIVRASALSRLAGQASHLDPSVLDKATADTSPLVRRSAAGLLAEQSPGAAANGLERLLGDPVRSVRLEAATAVTSILPDQRGSLEGALRKVLDEAIAAERFNSDRPEALVNLGGLLAEKGDGAAAQQAFEAARRRDPAFLPAYINLADVLRAQGLDAQAEKVLRDALPHAGSSGMVHHTLELTLVRQGRIAQALPLFKEAVAREPANARFAYVCAVALQEAGERGAAIEVLRKAVAANPDSPELQAALRQFSGSTH